MGKSVVVGSLLACLVACGGGIDTASSGDQAPPGTPSEQGVYQPPVERAPETVAAGLGTPTALVTAGSRVLFTTRTTVLQGQTVTAGALHAAEQVHGPALLIAIDREGASFDALATDGTTAFVATSNGRLLAVPVAGGALVTLASLAEPAVALATDGKHLYYATTSGTLGRVVASGGEPETLATTTAPVRGLAADGDALYVAAGASEERAAGILRVTPDGAVTAVATGAEPCALVREGQDLFWTSRSATAVTPLGSNGKDDTLARGEVHRLALGSGATATLVTAGAFEACSLAASGNALYFAGTVPGSTTVRAGHADGAGFGLLRAPTTGGEPVALTAASRVQSGAGAVAVSNEHVYWLTETAVLRLRR